MAILNLPLQFYINKIERNEPFASLLYGDGEFQVASRKWTRNVLQYGEIVTPQLEDEMYDSLNDTSTDIIRGTDESLIDYMSYKGRDFEQVKNIGLRVNELLFKFPKHNWVDGTIWDFTVREGKLGPFLKILRDKGCVLVGNSNLTNHMMPILNCVVDTIPKVNAFSVIDEIEDRMVDMRKNAKTFNIFVLCMGLGAIPLVMRLRKRSEFDGCTFIDLGSVLDVFPRCSPNRGWRRELYAGPIEKYVELVESNLKQLK